MIRHEGELAVQRRTGLTRDNIGSSGLGVRLPSSARDFLATRPFVVIAVRDEQGHVWTSMLTGPPGFTHAEGDDVIVIEALPTSDDPLYGVLAGSPTEEVDAPGGAVGAAGGREIGVIAIEPVTRRRMRVNGRVVRAGGRLIVVADQVFANCPKYITPRDVPALGAAVGTARGSGFTDAERAVVARADTFFVGTHVPGLGADASHRGGPPGFVVVTGPRTLAWPDYHGNSMYLTLGNLELDPGCGLLFPDWEGGRPLRLTGRATIDWSPSRAAMFRGAERVIDFELGGFGAQGGRPK